MPLIWFPIALLGVWRVTHLLVAEDGPWDGIARLREAAGTGFWGKLLDCFSCLSLWVSVPFALALGGSWPEHALLWPALSGGAILIDRIAPTETKPAEEREPAPAPYSEEPSSMEEADVLLRR